VPDGLLERVRALLAKAEATTFDEEAEAFTTKAQELMARHRIERAMLHEHQERESPVGWRVWVDAPHADAKAILLSRIASANDCDAVWTKRLGLATVFGFPADLELVDALFTSLLVQLTGALQREGSKQDPDGRSRTTSFRRAFIIAFAYRIGERLSAVVSETVASAEAEYGGTLLPVLASRAEAARAALEAAFPRTTSFRDRALDADGWHAGRSFGDAADIGVRRMVTSKSA
jgi:hypothetical protein